MRADRNPSKPLVAQRATHRLGRGGASRARSTLGPEHPLSRNIERVHVLVQQAAAAASAVALGVLAVAERKPWGLPLASAAAVVELALVAARALVRQIQREHVLRLIASGGRRVELEEVTREVRRLTSPECSAQLADWLERTLYDARHWHEIPRGSRPPHGLKRLNAFRDEIDSILAALQSGHAEPQGVALLELMLSGGDESALFAGDALALREQLRRIRHLISARTDGDASQQR